MRSQTKSTNPISSASCILLIAVSIMLLSVSCARSIAFNRSITVPAATGKVQLKKDGNNNYAITVKIKNLATPDNLPSPRSTYIVWMETQNSGVKNLGQLQSTKKLFSSARKAALKTVTTFEPMRFFITAENNATIEYPNYQHILETDTFH